MSQIQDGALEYINMSSKVSKALRNRYIFITVKEKRSELFCKIALLMRQ